MASSSSQNGTITVALPASLYGEEIIFRAVHRFTGRCSVTVRLNGDEWAIEFSHPESLYSLDRLKAEFENVLVDERLREIVRRESEPIRNLIIAQAFSWVNVIAPRLDEVQPGADPEGISQPDIATGRVHG